MIPLQIIILDLKEYEKYKYIAKIYTRFNFEIKRHYKIFFQFVVAHSKSFLTPILSISKL